MEASASIESITSLFRAEVELTAVPIVENGNYLGIVSRSQLYKSLSRAYALDIYSRRPIASLLDKQAIPMSPQTDIHAALAALLKIDPALSIDSIPIVSEGDCIGIVSVSSLLMSISRSQSALLQMLEELTYRLRDEVKKAAQVQQALLPLPNFSVPHIGISADLRTSSEIGGDFYDYFLIDRNRLCAIIADVSGHGVQAGMITTAAKASLHTLVRKGVDTPAALLAEMNNSILATTRQALLMTCLVAIIDPGKREICYANAGHNFPYLCRGTKNTVQMLENPSSFPLGFDPDGVFKEITIEFNPGDTFVLYSDGINECSNGTEDYGYTRLESCLSDLVEHPPEMWAPHILHSLSAFLGNEGLRDDATLVVVGYKDAAGCPSRISA
jgi:serine phosphatase RsbU (regulator of sigma subunit)